MFGSEYLKYKNRIYAHANGILVVSDVKKYVDDIEKLIKEKVEHNWTFLADLRGMDRLSDDCYVELNRLRKIMLSSENKIAKSAVVVDSLVNQIKSEKAMYELEDTFKEEYFTEVSKAEEYLDKN